MPELKARKQIRLKDYDYSVNGYYFITICSYNREIIFGELNVGAGLASARKQNTTTHNKIKLSQLGHIIDNQWNDIPNQYINIKLDYYIIMPNHIHGILVIHNQMDREGTRPKEDARPSPTISDIICSFKSKCTVEYIKYIKQNDLNISGKYGNVLLMIISFVTNLL